jgi:hypothetical protein
VRNPGIRFDEGRLGETCFYSTQRFWFEENGKIISKEMPFYQTATYDHAVQSISEARSLFAFSMLLKHRTIAIIINKCFMIRRPLKIETLETR